MDQGHYNCRNYYISPHFSPTTIVSQRNQSQPQGFSRHESFDELEQRSRSPASQRPKFPLLKLPWELRQQILSYLLPHTQDFKDSGLLSEHARNFSAVRNRGARGMPIPNAASAAGVSNVVWQRGNINLFCVCKQLHQECSELVYAKNTFLLFVSYLDITFRFRWLLPSGLAPSRKYNLLKLLPEKYMRMIKRVVVHVDHVDSYTGMIKFNVGGRGLTHGLRRQIQRLVNALRSPVQNDGAESDDRQLAKVNIRVSNGNAVLDALKSDIVRQREGGIKVSEDLEEMLEPFGDLRGVREVNINGAVTERFARALEEKMTSIESVEDRTWTKVDSERMWASNGGDVPLCVYGNDMS